MASSKTENRTDVYTRVTNKIIADLENGVRTWTQPWNVTHAAGRVTRPLRQSGTPYQGVNVLLLWPEAVERGYASPIWMTYKQAEALQAHVRKGERGSMVVYADRFTKTDVNDRGEQIGADPVMAANVTPYFHRGGACHLLKFARPPPGSDDRGSSRVGRQHSLCDDPWRRARSSRS